MSVIKMNFNTDIAKLVGTDAAIIYSNIEYWVEHNKLNKKHFYEGNFWTYNSVEAFGKYFDYLSNSQIKTCLNKLEKSKLIIIGNFNKQGYDRTKWYSIPLESTIGEKPQMDLSESANPLDENRQPIPDYKPNNKLIIDNKKEISLFSENEIKPIDKQKKIDVDDVETLFKKSVVFDIEIVKEKLSNEISLGIDVDYYFNVVSDWNETKRVKRTPNGWIATFRTFMRRDNENKKLKFVNGSQPIQNNDDELAYLKM